MEKHKPVVAGSEEKQFTLHVLEAQNLQTFLRAKLPEYSHTTLKSWLIHRRLFLNGSVLLTRFDHPLQVGDKVQVRTVKKQHGHFLDHPKLCILFEDEEVVVVEKKEGLLSVRTENDQESASHLLNQYLRVHGRQAHIYAVHRLDRDTSGVMLFAKTKETQQAFRDAWTERVLEREYMAVVEGRMEQPEGTIVSYLTEDARKKMHASLTDNGGQRAVTHYRVLGGNARYSLLSLHLETGRKNQIRVQMASIGHPVSGDAKYGGHRNPLHRMCLHAHTLQFIHPATGKQLRFEIPVPDTFYLLSQVSR